MTDRHLHTVRAETAPTPIQPLVKDEPNDPEIRSFLRVVYRALSMITSYLKKTYNF